MQAKFSKKISVAVIAHNEENNLPGLLDTLDFTDEVVVLDAGSSDRTAEIARGAGARVLEGENLRNLNVNKTRAVEATTGDWIIYLDADERVPPELADEIRAAAEENGRGRVAFTMPRLNQYFGKYLRHGGAYPDTQLRLFKRGKARFPCMSVHEKLDVDGPVGKLRTPLIHDSYPTLAEYMRKFPFYVQAGADHLERKGVRPGIINTLKYFAVKPAFRFLRRYVIRFGFLDGWRGFAAAAMDAYQYVMTYAAYLDRKRKKT
jgi:glycosyltransferase involved in cell wall biosynthesis